MINKKIIVFTVLSLIALGSSLSAFDNQRKGFVLGGGGGIILDGNWSTDKSVNYYYVGTRSRFTGENFTGFGLSLLFGYAWSNNNMLVFEANTSEYNSRFLNHTIIQGFNGLVWYHYFGSGNRFYTTAGGGFYFLGGYHSGFKTSSRFGALIGGGYEITPHVQMGAYVSAGKSESEGVDFKHSQLSILISAIAF